MFYQQKMKFNPTFQTVYSVCTVLIPFITSSHGQIVVMVYNYICVTELYRRMSMLKNLKIYWCSIYLDIWYGIIYLSIFMSSFFCYCYSFVCLLYNIHISSILKKIWRIWRNWNSYAAFCMDLPFNSVRSTYIHCESLIKCMYLLKMVL